jgi:hypothetical protein
MVQVLEGLVLASTGNINRGFWEFGFFFYPASSSSFCVAAYEPVAESA